MKRACSFFLFLLQDDLLKILGEKHPLFDFLNVLSVKCSFVLFSKEHVKEFLLELTIQKSTGNTENCLSCVNMLVVSPHFSELLLVIFSVCSRDLVLDNLIYILFLFI